MANIKRGFLSSSTGDDQNNDRKPPMPLRERLMREKGKAIIKIEDEDEDAETNHAQIVASDTESCTSNDTQTKSVMFGIEMVRVEEGDLIYDNVKRRFLSGIGELANYATVELVHKNAFSSFAGQAQVQSFKLYSDAVEKHRGDANIRFAWYGASKEGVSRILYHGFTKYDKPEIGDQYGLGIYLSPEGQCFDSLRSSTMDEKGMRHLILCRVILGNVEEIQRGSEQFHPSSLDFDSGCDNLLIPMKYIIWTTSMNTHILPEFVMSFRGPVSLEGFRRAAASGPVRAPTSPWVGFNELIAEMSKDLTPHQIILIEKFYKDFCEKKITRQHMCQVIRQTTGDQLILQIIKRCKAKKNEGRRIPLNI